MKKLFLLFFVFFFINSIFAESNIETFVKGNISDKTSAVRKATGKDAVWLSNKAITFVFESKEILGNDRELDGLAVAAILSFPQDYVKNSSDQAKEIILNNFMNLFEVFSGSTTVQTAIISKVASFKNVMNISPFVKILNKYITNTNLATAEADVVNSVLNLILTNGDNESFTICYYLWATNKYPSKNAELENIIVSLLPVSLNEAIAIANNSNIDAIIPFFNLLYTNKSKINQNSLSEIAGNVLSNTILLMKSSKVTPAATELQMQTLKILSENKWTRASSVVLSFFENAKTLYSNKELSEDDFVVVIKSLNNVSPLEAVTPLVNYLETLNSMVEKQQEVSDPVVLAVINTLGAIGDKSAFDTLLSVTYYNYPQPVLSAAREALSGLKW